MEGHFSTGLSPQLDSVSMEEEEEETGTCSNINLYRYHTTGSPP